MKTILLVEDETSVLNALVDKLKHEGYAVLIAKNGADGLAIALQHHPDLVLLDILMPVMDGQEMLKLLRDDPWGKTAKVLFLTNLSSVTTAEEYLVKSNWTLQDIANKVRAMLHHD